MRRAGRIGVVVTAAALMWVGVAYQASRPPDYDAYHRTATQVARAAHDAVRTGWLTGRQELAGKVFPTYATVAFDDAAKALAGAQKTFASEAPPDGTARALRDELAPLLAAATTLLGDAAGAADDAALRHAVDRLDDLADRLDHFQTAHG
jgi:hypothetical protein